MPTLSEGDYLYKAIYVQSTRKWVILCQTHRRVSNGLNREKTEWDVVFIAEIFLGTGGVKEEGEGTSNNMQVRMLLSMGWAREHRDGWR